MLKRFPLSILLLFIYLTLGDGGCGGKYPRPAAHAGSPGHVTATYGFGHNSGGYYGGSYPGNFSYYYRPYSGYNYSYYPSYLSYSVPESYANPGDLGYTYYPAHQDGERRFPAGYYRYDKNAGAWQRYGAGYEYGQPANPSPPPLPVLPKLSTPPPMSPADGGSPLTPEEIQVLKKLLDKLKKD